ncbi:MAG: hypothetical protein JW941_08575, partial [Candidatus Coatesbacteria bacterium]|nr:hypothetical protein [Candidatus Coatesbacteria bacterium]
MNDTKYQSTVSSKIPAGSGSRAGPEKEYVMSHRRPKFHLMAVTAILLCLPVFSAAFVQPTGDNHPLEIPLKPHVASSQTDAQLQALELLTAKSPVEVEFSDQTGTPRSVHGRLLNVAGREEARLAEKVLEYCGALYGIRPDLDKLVPLKTTNSYSYKHTYFEQQFDGVPVWRAGLAAHVDGAGLVRLINGEFYRDIDVVTEPVLSASDAEDVTLSFISPAETSDITIKSRLVIAPTERFRLSYEVKILCSDPIGSFVALIDAETGNILYFKNEMLFSRVTGNVYDESPDKTPLEELPIRDMKVSSAGGTHYTDSDGYYDAEGEVTATLEGPYCRALNEDVAAASYEGDATFMWDYSPLSTHFDEVCVFYHVNQIHAWLKDHLEYDGMDFEIPVTTHYGTDLNNAMFSPGYNRIMLGDGTIRDPAHEADVVMHEYGHAVVHNTSFEDFSNLTLNEGYADYFTCSLHDDPLLGEWWMPPYLRNLDNDLVYPFDLAGESHHDGQIWSGALWDIRELFGADVADRIALGTLFYYGSPYPSFLDARDAALWADTEYFDSEHQQAMVEIFSKRGMTEVSVASWSLAEVVGNGNGTADPGETIDLSIQMRNLTSSRILTAYLMLSSDSDYVEVTQGVAETPLLKSYGKGAPDTPFRFVISPDCPADSILELKLMMGYEEDGPIFADTIKVSLGGGPEVSLQSHEIYDYVGNGDGEANPGEVIVILPTVTNIGTKPASNVRLRAFVRSPYVNARGGYYAEIYNDSASLGDIQPGETLEAYSSEDSLIQLIESDAPNGLIYEVDYDIFEDGGRKWTGTFQITVTGQDKTPPWVAYANGSPRMLEQGEFFYAYALIIEPGDIYSIDATLRNRAGEPQGNVNFFQYTEGLYMAFGYMPADEDVFLDITSRDGKGNEGTRKNACAFGPPTFTPHNDVLLVADDFADSDGTREATYAALADKGISVDVWETEIRQLPGK